MDVPKACPGCRQHQRLQHVRTSADTFGGDEVKARAIRAGLALGTLSALVAVLGAGVKWN
jgi:hypothetical protein